MTKELLQQALVNVHDAILRGNSDGELLVMIDDALRDAKAQQEPIKDHEIAQLVNTLTATAIEFHDSQQLRQRISQLIVPALKGKAQQEQTAQEKCWCDQNNIGEPGVSCGDCPTRDYKQPALSDLIELAKVYSQQYASPHHIVFSVDGLRHLIEAHLKGQK